MKELYKITEEKTVTKLIKILNENNQILKNIYNSEEEYFYIKGKIYTSYTDQLPQFVKCNLNEDSKFDEINDFFNNTSFLIKGQEFFEFIVKQKNKDNKPIEVTVYEDYSFIIRKKNGETLEFKYNFIKAKEKINSLNRLLTNFGKLNNDYKLMSADLDTKYIDKLLDNPNKVYRFILDVDNNKVFIDNNRDNDENRDSYTEITLSKKFILGLKVKKLKKGNIYNQVKVDLYCSDKDNLFLVNFQTFTDFCSIEQFFIIVDLE